MYKIYITYQNPNCPIDINYETRCYFSNENLYLCNEFINIQYL